MWVRSRTPIWRLPSNRGYTIKYECDSLCYLVHGQHLGLCSSDAALRLPGAAGLCRSAALPAETLETFGAGQLKMSGERPAAVYDVLRRTGGPDAVSGRILDYGPLDRCFEGRTAPFPGCGLAAAVGDLTAASISRDFIIALYFLSNFSVFISSVL